MAEWLRRWTANPMVSGGMGSNPLLVNDFLILHISPKSTSSHWHWGLSFLKYKCLKYINKYKELEIKIYLRIYFRPHLKGDVYFLFISALIKFNLYELHFLLNKCILLQ